MNLVTQDFLDNYLLYERRFKEDPGWVFDKTNAMKAKLVQELSHIERNGSACPQYRDAEFRENIGSLKLSDLKTDLDKNFFNSDLMKVISCSVDAMFYGIPESQGQLSVSEVIRQHLRNLKVISSGSYGSGGSAEIDNTKDLVWYKMPLDKNVKDDLLHEGFVGLLGLNNLRSQVPNFCYVWGVFRCGKAQTSVEGDVINFCSKFQDPDPGSATSVPWLMLENLKGSPTAYSYLQKAGLHESLSLYLQVLFALNTAQSIKFTHNDLHTFNVLMRDVSNFYKGTKFNGVYIPYQFEGVTYYVLSDKIATIIDFGMSGFEYDDGTTKVYHGPPMIDKISYSVFNDKPWSLRDAYQFLMYIIQAAMFYNNEKVYDVFREIFRFFNPTLDPRELVVGYVRDKNDKIVGLDSDGGAQQIYHFGLPMNERTQRFAIKDLIKAVLKMIEKIGVVTTAPREGITIIECNGCLSFNQIAAASGAKESTPHPRTFFNFYDVALIFTNAKTDKDKKMAKYLEMGKNFDYVSASKDFCENVNNLLKDVHNINSNIFHVQLDSSNVFQKLTLMNVRRLYEKIFNFLRILEDLAINIRVGKFMSETFQDANLGNFVSDAQYETHKYQPVVCELINEAIKGYDTVIFPAMQNSKEWRDIYYNDPDFRWYYENAGDIQSIKNRACVSPVIPEITPHPKQENTAPRTFSSVGSTSIPYNPFEQRSNSPRSRVSRANPYETLKYNSLGAH